MGSSQIKKDIRPRFLFKAKGFVLPLGEHTKIMGVINATPDSFSSDGLLAKSKRGFVLRSVRLSQEMVRNHVDILDVGGESSRPGSHPVTIKEELARVIPIVKALRRHFKIPISVDTYKKEVAEEALACGAAIINNIMGTQLDKGLIKIIKEYNAAIVLMHMKGAPQTMQNKIVYKRLIPEIINALRKSLEICLEMGLKSDRICIDPGIGFGKTAEQNLEIINRLKEFQKLNAPILIGTSRKSFIGKILNKNTDERLMGTIASVVLSAYNGAHIVRVHDVKETYEALQVTDAVIKGKDKA